MTLLTHAANFVRDENGQDLIEYALIVALIALVCVGALATVGTNVKTIFTSIGDKLTTPAGS
jgi:pilus assembly protein Flp/PilA